LERQHILVVDRRRSPDPGATAAMQVWLIGRLRVDLQRSIGSLRRIWPVPSKQDGLISEVAVVLGRHDDFELDTFLGRRPGVALDHGGDISLHWIEYRARGVEMIADIRIELIDVN